MQTILGASGQIGIMLAKSLQVYTDKIKIVSRNPNPINTTDFVVSADLLSIEQTKNAVEGSAVTYLTAGLPMDTTRWIKEWPVIMANVIEACSVHHSRLVFFDNTYMYPQTSEPQTEKTVFEPYGEKGKIRGMIAQQLLDAIKSKQVEALICRAPEFYGPGLTQSITNRLVIEPLLHGKVAKVLLSDQTKRTLIYTPDASRAMALLGNTPRAYGETWHLPCSNETPTYSEFIAKASQIFERPAKYKVLPRWQIKAGAYFNKNLKELISLLPRYSCDTLFVSEKFKKAFPTFKTTTIEQGLSVIWKEHTHSYK